MRTNGSDCPYSHQPKPLPYQPKLLRAAVLSSIIASACFGAPNPATAQDKPNILFIMGDDIGWMQPSIYHRGLAVGETPNIDRIGNEGAIFMTYYAEQSCTAGRTAFFTGMHPLRVGMILPEIPGQPVLPADRHTGTREVPARSWLQRPASSARTISAITPSHCRPRTGSKNIWGYLYHLDAMQGVSFPDINKSPTEQTVAPPCKNTPDPGPV